MNRVTVLLVDDEEHILHTFSMILERAGYERVTAMSDPQGALPYLAEHKNVVVVLDLMMPNISGCDLLLRIKADFPDVPVIVMTAVSDVDKAVGCMKRGAFDFMVKPVDEKRFLSCIANAEKIIGMHEEIERLKTSLLDEDLRDPGAFSPILTKSGKMRAIFRYIEAIADSSQPVMISGETGVGKGLLAKALHRAAQRKGDFVPVDVAGLDETVFSDTLFGHEKGAYTGAEKKRDGMIVKASAGTLFLDEIGDLNEASQIRILRLIEERTYYPLGSDLQKRSDARIVVATNRDLKALTAEGKFRKDLFYRLSSHQVTIPPLCERTEDLPLLVDVFVAEAAQSMNRKKPAIPEELLVLLAAYHFPGNIRELKGLIYDAVARNTTKVLSLESFRSAIGLERSGAETVTTAAATETNSLTALFGHYPSLKEIEEFTINEALKIAKGNQGIAASMLGISRQALNNRLRKRD